MSVCIYGYIMCLYAYKHICLYVYRGILYVYIPMYIYSLMRSGSMIFLCYMAELCSVIQCTSFD